MNKEELYKLAISDVPKYSLLNEILAIRDNRFPNEEVDYCINVNGYISLDVLNKYVRNINELEQLQNNWNELKTIINKKIKDNREDMLITQSVTMNSIISSENIGLRYALDKIQELEGNNE